jgi:catechol 2,3-dioxygenase
VHKTTGLYHFALRVEARVDLGRVLERVIQAQVPVVGVADHGVSEAVYLQDPDENGIEIYRDRPREEWPESDGDLEMVTEPLDVDGLLALSRDHQATVESSSPFRQMGHVHLHVSDLHAAEQFYGAVLGFELRQRYGNSAAFFAAGGYHHHIGLNTWAGAGAPPPPEDALGLNWYAIWLPERTALDAVIERVRSARVEVEETDDGYRLRDPSRNVIRLTTAPSV